jgi:lipoyl(octanoyl) transferase
MSGDVSPLRCAWLGTVPYGEALELQRSLLEQRKVGAVPDTLLLLEHPHVYTLGRRAAPQDVIAPPEVLRAIGAEVFETDRGGEVTYHGPGQLVAYPVFSIREAGLGPLTYVRILEQAVIEVLRESGVNGHRVVGKTGVWVGGEPGTKPEAGQNPAGRKIAAMGVRVSAGVAMHGFALNVTSDLSYFSHIVPCGMPGLPVTSIAAETGERIATSDVAASAASRLGALLQRDLNWVDSKAIAA